MAFRTDKTITKQASALRTKIPPARLIQAVLIGCKASRIHFVPAQIMPTSDKFDRNCIDYTDWLDTRFGGRFLVDTADFKHYFYRQVHEDQAHEGTTYVIFTETQENRRSEQLNLYVRRLTDYNVTWYGNILVVKQEVSEYDSFDDELSVFQDCGESDILAVVRHVLNVVYTQPFRIEA